MVKSDANIKVGADTTAFSKAIDGLEKGITEKLEKIGNIFMGALGLKAAAQNIAGAFSSFTEPAAELENVATSLGVVMGNAEATEQRARIQEARVEFIQGFQANVVGGGVSFRLGNSQLQESKKHGRLLKEIRDYLRGQRNTASGVAVLA